MRIPIGIRGAYLVFLGLLPLAVDFSSYMPYEQIKIMLFLFATDIAIILLATQWARAPKERAGGESWRFSQTDLFVLGLLAAYALSTILSPDPMMSFVGSHDRGTGLFYWLHVGACYFILRTGTTEGEWRGFLRMTAVAALMASAYALAQRLGWDVYGLAGNFALYGLSGPTRAFATLGHPNFLGAWLAMALPLLAYAAMHDPVRSWRRASFAAASASGVTIVLTYSRGAWIAAVAALITYAVLRVPRSRSWYVRASIALTLAAAIGVAVLVTLGPSLTRSSNTFISRLGTTLDFSFGSNLARSNEWSYALSLIAERPVVGYGFDTYMPYAANRVKSPLERNRDFAEADPSVADRLHNTILDTTWVGGLLALTMLASICVTTLAVARRALAHADRRRCAASAAWTAALVAYVVANLVSFDFSISGIWLFLLLAGLQDEESTHRV